VQRATGAAGLTSIADANARGTASVWGLLPSSERLGFALPPLSPYILLTSVLMIAEPMFVHVPVVTTALPAPGDCRLRKASSHFQVDESTTLLLSRPESVGHSHAAVQAG
jgi:hypothetical protein